MGKTVNVRDMKVDTKYKVNNNCKKLLTKVLGGLSGQGITNDEPWYELTFEGRPTVNVDWYASYEECSIGGGKSRRNRKSKSRKGKSRKGTSRKSNRRR